MARCSRVALFGVAMGVVAVASCSASPGPAAGGPATGAAVAPTAAPGSPPPAGSAAGHTTRELRALPQIVGEITAENDAIWTVRANNGQTYTVTITPQTIFGARKHPATRDQFPVGARTRIRGDLQGTAMTASQVRLPSEKLPDS